MMPEAPRILLLGATGQVGFELWRCLQATGPVLATARQPLPGVRVLDLTDADAVEALLADYRPQIIANAAAWTAVDAAEETPEACWRLNARLPEQLARWGAEHHALLLHYSTDYVFDGRARQPLDEARSTAPLGVYGQSKRAGEVAIQQAGCPSLIFRTAWVYASRGHNFLLTMLRLARERDQLSVVDDQIGSPTWARLIAQVSAQALQQWLAAGADPDDPRLGLWHLTASGQTSWHGFATALLEQAQALGLIERLPDIQPIPSSAFPTPAQRPAWSVLDNRAIQRAFGCHLPDWQHGMQLCLQELAERGPTP